MEKKIYCVGCSKYLGVIRDALLHKDISYICKSCNNKRVALELKQKSKVNTSDPFTDLFGGPLF